MRDEPFLCCDWQVNGNEQSTFGMIAGIDISTMQNNGAFGDGKAQAVTAIACWTMALSGFRGSEKGLKQLAQVGIGYAFTMIAYGYDGMGFICLQ